MSHPHHGAPIRPAAAARAPCPLRCEPRRAVPSAPRGASPPDASRGVTSGTATAGEALPAAITVSIRGLPGASPDEGRPPRRDTYSPGGWADGGRRGPRGRGGGAVPASPAAFGTAHGRSGCFRNRPHPSPVPRFPSWAHGTAMGTARPLLPSVYLGWFALPCTQGRVWANGPQWQCARRAAAPHQTLRISKGLAQDVCAALQT